MYSKSQGSLHGRGVKTETSKRLFDEARRCIPGGVNSPVRAMKGVGMPHPLFVSRARGAHIWDADGNELVDFVSSWGPMILGWGHPEVVGTLHAQLDLGTSFGAPTELEVELARLICDAVPVGRARAHGQLGHRGHDERPARGARLHRPRQGRQVRGLLPRPRRPVPGGRRQRRAHPGAARQPRRHHGHHGRHHPRRVQRRRRRWHEVFAARGGRDRLRHRRAGGRQHGRRAARSPAFSRRRAGCAPTRARCSSSTR